MALWKIYQRKEISNIEDKVSVVCLICNKIEFVTHRRAESYKTCSKKCLKAYRKTLNKNKLKDKTNYKINKDISKTLDMPKRKEKIINNKGYISIYMPEHPLCTASGYVFEHRLVAEKFLPNKENSLNINGSIYLKPQLEVHHIDFNPSNNDPSNLMVLTKIEHLKYKRKK